MTASRRVLIVVGVLVAVALGLPWGGAVPEASAQTIQVTSATPSSADQGTVSLPVTIKGNGFKKGAKAAFYRHDNGLPGGIAVTSTKFVSSTQVVATIDVAADATTEVTFDIEVKNADGRTGKGTDLFSVTEKIDACAAPDPVPTLNPLTADSPGSPGFFDATFGAGGTGKVIGPAHMEVEAAAVQQVGGEGRIIVVGHSTDPCEASSHRVWLIARYLPEGSPDLSFGTNGIVTTSFLDAAWAFGVAIQPDGKIVVVGYAPTVKKRGIWLLRPTIARYNVNGSLDTTFATAGVLIVPGSDSGRLEGVAVQSDGKIVAVGIMRASAVVIRVTPNGVLDETFNGNGQYLYDAGPVGESWAHAVMTQQVGSDERIIAAGMISDGSDGRHWHFGLWRFDSSGALDSSFGTSGVVTTEFGGYHDFLNGVALDPTGNSIVAVGYTYPDAYATTSQVAMARYDASGRPDPGFGNDGRVLVSRRMQREAATCGVAIQPDGRILVGGSSGVDFGENATVWRFDADGTPDLSFAGSGQVNDPLIASGTNAAGYALLLQADGKVVWAGFADVPGNPYIRFAALARFWQ